MDLDQEIIVEAVEALVEKKEREADRMVSDSYEALKLADEIYVLENYLMFGQGE